MDGDPVRPLPGLVRSPAGADRTKGRIAKNTAVREARVVPRSGAAASGAGGASATIGGHGIREASMSDGYERAQGQRNLLERLGAKIPGYRGFQDRELRRDVDRLQREHLAAELGRLKAALATRARDYTDAGQLAALAGFGRLDRQLDGLQQTIRFSDYGASG